MTCIAYVTRRNEASALCCSIIFVYFDNGEQAAYFGFFRQFWAFFRRDGVGQQAPLKSPEIGIFGGISWEVVVGGLGLGLPLHDRGKNLKIFLSETGNISITG